MIPPMDRSRNVPSISLNLQLVSGGIYRPNWASSTFANRDGGWLRDDRPPVLYAPMWAERYNACYGTTNSV
jgi:hypothetical protein